MASPTKNFIDPTGVSRTADGLTKLSAYSSTSIKEPGRMLVVLLPSPTACDLMFVPGQIQAADARLTITNTVRSKLPPPPMGRQILLTFPPIYKERGGSVRDMVAQTWPRLVKSK